MQPIIFIPHGNISYGKLAQALEYGAQTLQVEANFDQILALVRVLAEQLGIYLLNSINPFRIEGQKTIMVEMMDQRDWNVAGLGRAARRQPGQCLGVRQRLCARCTALGLIDRLPRLAVIQAEGSAPFYDSCSNRPTRLPTPSSIRKRWPPRSRSAIRCPGPKRCTKSGASNGVVEKVTEQEIADAKAVIGAGGIGCEPASAATLAGIRKLRGRR